MVVSARTHSQYATGSLSQQFSSETSSEREIIPLVARLLKHMTRSNDLKAPLVPSPCQAYESKTVPGLSIDDYMARMAKYTHCRSEAFIVAMIYVDKLVEKTGLMVTSKNVHRMVLSCIVLASKFLYDDNSNKLSNFCRVGGVRLSEMISLEATTFSYLWKILYVGQEEYGKYLSVLKALQQDKWIEKPLPHLDSSELGREEVRQRPKSAHYTRDVYSRDNYSREGGYIDRLSLPVPPASTRSSNSSGSGGATSPSSVMTGLSLSDRSLSERSEPMRHSRPQSAHYKDYNSHRPASASLDLSSRTYSHPLYSSHNRFEELSDRERHYDRYRDRDLSSDHHSHHHHSHHHRHRQLQRSQSLSERQRELEKTNAYLQSLQRESGRRARDASYGGMGLSYSARGLGGGIGLQRLSSTVGRR